MTSLYNFINKHIKNSSIVASASSAKTTRFLAVNFHAAERAAVSFQMFAARFPFDVVLTYISFRY